MAIERCGPVVTGRKAPDRFALVYSTRWARISCRSSSRSARLFRSCLKNSSSMLTTMAFTLTLSASAHSRNLTRASLPM